MNKEKQIKFALEQLIQEGNLDVIDAVFAIDYMAHAEGKVYKGHDFIRKFTAQVRSAIPDIGIMKIEFLVNTVNTIAWQRTLQGSHKNSMMGIPASQKRIRWNEMVVSRFSGDKISEEWVVSELAAQLLLNQPFKK